MVRDVPLTFRQLQYFVVTAEEGSISRAADRLYVAQPSLSQQLAALERAVRGPLFHRLPRGVALTMMGRAFLPRARDSLELAGAAVRDARRVGELGGGDLNIGALATITAGLLPPVLRAWLAAYPDVELVLREFRIHQDELPAALVTGQVDIAVGPLPTDWDGAQRALGVEEFVLVLPPGEDPSATIESLADRRWVLYESGNGLGEIVAEALGSRGVFPDVAVRTGAGASAVQLAAAGLGPTIVPANIVPEGLNATVIRPEPAIRRELAVFGLPAASDVVNAFADIADGLGRQASHGTATS